MEIIYLLVAYIIPLLLVVWLWLGMSGRIVTKIIVTLLLPVFYLAHWAGLAEIRGWPYEKNLPEQFQLISADVVEVDKSTGAGGWIYLWVRPNGGEDPRVYK